MEDRYDVTLEELINELREYGEFTESALCEVLGHDLFYFPVYRYMDFEANGKVLEILGFFLIYLKDGIAILPFDENYMGNGWEQLMEIGFRYVNEDDYETLLDCRKSMFRSIQAIDASIHKMRLRLVTSRGFTKEQLESDKKETIKL